MKPLAHARLGAARHGGSWHETIALHTWLDSSKSSFASVQHRALLHHDAGMILGQMIFGSITLGSGQRHAAEALLADHIVEDLGSVVPVRRWLDEIDADGRRPRRLHPEHRNLMALRSEPAADACAVRWGGSPTDYESIINILDLPHRMSDGHPAARALFHNSFGPFVVESVIGPAIELHSGRLLATRTVCEDLIHARMGWIPPASYVLARIPLKPWMTGGDSTMAIAARKGSTQPAATASHI